MFPVTENAPRLSLYRKWRLRRKRQRLLFRAWRKRRDLTEVRDCVADSAPNAILCFATMRNEMARLPHFLQHYRGLGVGHFLIVVNESDDGTEAYLLDQPDVSVWRTGVSYRLARFGMDWITWLQIRYAHDRWSLCVDADELLVLPHDGSRDLHDLTAWMQKHGYASFGATMVDLYPEGPVGEDGFVSGGDPVVALPYYDARGYRSRRHPRFDNLWVQGGVRERVFFATEPTLSPTLNKQILVKWNRRFAYVSSTHQALPVRLNQCYPTATDNRPWGVLLHTKFLAGVADRSAEEIERGEHFENSHLYGAYYRMLMKRPTLYDAASSRYEGWAKLEKQGLIWRGDWV